MIIDTTDETINNLDKKSVLVFSAPWCGPCKVLKPHLEVLSLSDQNCNNCNVDIIYIDCDDNLEITKELGISSIPCIYIYIPGDTLDKKNVVISSDIVIIETHLRNNNIASLKDLGL